MLVSRPAVIAQIDHLLAIHPIVAWLGPRQCGKTTVDRPHHAARFLLSGSASPHRVRGVSESLAGRVGFVDLSGFNLAEVSPAPRDRLWLRGGFPRSFLCGTPRSSPDRCELPQSPRVVIWTLYL